MKTLRSIAPTSRVGALNYLSTAVVAAMSLATATAYAQSGRPDPNAETTDVAILLGAGSTDNVRRATTSEQSASYKLVGVVLDVVRTGPRLNATLGGDIEFRDYSVAGLDSDRVGVMDASLELVAVPERFSWLVDARAGQGRTDPFGVESPENREDIDIVETGPRVRFPIGNRSDLRLSGTAGKREFEISNAFDSDTTEVEAGFYRAVSSTSEFGFVVSTREVSYDVAQFDNEVDRAYVTYSRQLATGSAAFELGTNRADFGTGAESSPYLTAAWQREVGTRSEVSLTFTNEFVDATDSIDYDRLVIYDVGSGGPLLTPDVYESTGFLASLTVVGTRTRFTIGAGLTDSDYENALALDNDSLRFNIGVEREMSTRTDLGLNVDGTRRDFKRAQQEDNDKFVELYLQRNFAGPFAARLGYARNSRSGQGTINYDENVLTFEFRYDISSTAAQ